MHDRKRKWLGRPRRSNHVGHISAVQLKIGNRHPKNSGYFFYFPPECLIVRQMAVERDHDYIFPVYPRIRMPDKMHLLLDDQAAKDQPHRNTKLKDQEAFPHLFAAMASAQLSIKDRNGLERGEYQRGIAAAEKYHHDQQCGITTEQQWGKNKTPVDPQLQQLEEPGPNQKE